MGDGGVCIVYGFGDFLLVIMGCGRGNGGGDLYLGYNEAVVCGLWETGAEDVRLWGVSLFCG